MKGDDLSVKLKDTQQYYHEVLKRISPKSHPVFEDPGMQERVWGRRWGVYDDVGPLKLVLVHRPGNEIKVMTKKKYDPSIEAMIDDDEQWYVLGEEPPNLEKMQEEHDQLMNILRKEGVEVVSVEGSPRDPKAMFTRDDGVAIFAQYVGCSHGTKCLNMIPNRFGAFFDRSLTTFQCLIVTTLNTINIAFFVIRREHI